MVAKVCWTSQGQPVAGSRSWAMIASRRSIGRSVGESCGMEALRGCGAMVGGLAGRVHGVEFAADLGVAGRSYRKSEDDDPRRHREDGREANENALQAC